MKQNICNKNQKICSTLKKKVLFIKINFFKNLNFFKRHSLKFTHSCKKKNTFCKRYFLELIRYHFKFNKVLFKILFKRHFLKFTKKVFLAKDTLFELITI